MDFYRSHKVATFIGGTAVSLAIGYGAYHYLFSDNSEERAGIKTLPKELVLKILKEMQKEFFSTFSSLAMIGMQIQQQSRNKIPPAELEYILSNQRTNKNLDKNFKMPILIISPFQSGDIRHRKQNLSKSWCH
jgi:hypothetical protein